MEPTIVVRGLRHAFGDLTVLDGVDLEVARGEVVALLGPNGAGKTTTVRVLSTLLRPDGGTVRVAGHDALRHPDRVRAAIALTGQFAAVDELLTGTENLRLMARLSHLPPDEERSRPAALLAAFDLTDAADRPVRTYSGGMRRRLDIAASLVGRPQVLVLDEPTTGLDPRSRLDVWALTRAAVDAGTTVLLTTQYLEEAERLADRVVVIDQGRVIAHGTPDELKARVGRAHVELVLADGTRERVETDGSVGDVRRVLQDVERRLERGGAAVESWQVRTPTLDDAFLALTGAPAQAARADSPAQAAPSAQPADPSAPSADPRAADLVTDRRTR